MENSNDVQNTTNVCNEVLADVIGRLFQMSENIARKHKAVKDRVLFTITPSQLFIHFYEISNDEERVERFLESVSVNDLYRLADAI